MGWTIEAEVYESLMTSNINEKYLPGHEIHSLDSTMELSDVTDTCEILVLALPSGVILSVVNELIPLFRPSHVLIDLAKGLAPTSESESGMISREIEDRLSAAGKSNPVVVMTGPTIAPEVARGVMTTALVACHDRSLPIESQSDFRLNHWFLPQRMMLKVQNYGALTRTRLPLLVV